MSEHVYVSVAAVEQAAKAFDLLRRIRDGLEDGSMWIPDCEAAALQEITEFLDSVQSNREAS